MKENTKYALKKKVFLFISGLFCCFGVFFLPSFASATDLVVPFTVSGPSDYILPPVTYDGITYTAFVNTYADYTEAYPDQYGFTSLYYIPVPGEKVVMEVSLGDIYMTFKSADILLCYNGGYLPFTVNNCSKNHFEVPTEYEHYIPMYNQDLDKITFLSSEDIYDSDGVNILYSSNVSYIDPNWTPGYGFDGNFQFTLPGFADGTAWMPLVTPYHVNNSVVPTFLFAPNETVYDIPFALIVSPLPTSDTRDIEVLQDNTVLERYEFTDKLNDISTGGYIEYVASRDAFVFHLTELSDNYVIKYYTDDGDWSYTFGIQLNSEFGGGFASAERNTFCAAMPHEITTWLGSISFPLDDLCSLILPPRDYLPNTFNGMVANIFGRFQFVSQVKTVLTDLRSTVSATPPAPTFPAVTLFGVTHAASSLAVFNDIMFFVRNLSSALIWIYFISFLFSWVKEIFLPGEKDPVVLD